MIQAALLAMLLDEASVSSIHAALDAKKVTCAQVVRHYLDRIAAYDDRGPGVNAIITVNPRAIETAEQMDRTPVGREVQPAAALHPGGPQRQLSHRRHADHRRLAHVREHADAGRRVRGEETPRRRRDHRRQGQPPRAGPRRHQRQLAGRPDEEPLRPDAHAGRIERRHRRRHRRELRRARHRQRHRPVDSIAVIRERPGRVARHARAGEPRRRDAVQHDAG